MYLRTDPRASCLFFCCPLQACCPTRSDWQCRVDIHTAVNQTLGTMREVKQGMVRPYGSFLSGFYNSAR